jgi:hypothetical protein
MKSLDKFMATYNQLDKTNLDLLYTIYHPKIHFADPAHSIDGLNNLKQYFTAMYENVRSIRFDFHDRLENSSQAFLTWTMHFSHARLAKGRSIAVSGCSRLEFAAEGKVIYHRDYFDLGAMLYEHIPVLGGIIKTIKQRLGP